MGTFDGEPHRQDRRNGARDQAQEDRKSNLSVRQRRLNIVPGDKLKIRTNHRHDQKEIDQSKSSHRGPKETVSVPWWIHDRMMGGCRHEGLTKLTEHERKGD